MSLNAQITLSLLTHEAVAGDMVRGMRVTPVNYAASLSDGTGANQAQLVWSDSRTLAGSSESLSLSSLPDTRDGASVSVGMTAIKALYFKNTGTATSLVVAGAPFPAGGQTIAAGAVAVQVDTSAGGMQASAVTVTGSAGATYDIMLIGNGSVT